MSKHSAQIQYRPATIPALSILAPRPAPKAPAPYFAKPAAAWVPQDGSRPAEFEKVLALAKGFRLSLRAARLKLLHNL